MEHSKMSSIHEIARIDDANKPNPLDDELGEKSQEEIEDELRGFEQSINQIDSKFVMLDNNLIKYQ